MIFHNKEKEKNCVSGHTCVQSGIRRVLQGSIGGFVDQADVSVQGVFGHWNDKPKREEGKEIGPVQEGHGNIVWRGPGVHITLGRQSQDLDEVIPGLRLEGLTEFALRGSSGVPDRVFKALGQLFDEGHSTTFTLSQTQVWSLTQFYYVSFLQSRIVVALLPNLKAALCVPGKSMN